MANHMPDTIYDVIVLGAGTQGILSAKTYLQCAPNASLLIIDSQRSLGGTWASERLYDGIQTQCPRPLYNFSDLPMDDEAEAGLVDCIPGKKVNEYLRLYAEKFGLIKRLRLSEMVEKVERDGDGWMVRTTLLQNPGGKVVYRTRQIIVATGTTSEPKEHVPFPGQMEFEKEGGRVFHCKFVPEHMDFLKGDDVKSVVVVGGGKYSVDMVCLAAELGKKVEWVIRPSLPSFTSPPGAEEIAVSGRGPPTLFPKAILGLNGLAALSNRTLEKLHPNMYTPNGFAYEFFHSGRWWIGVWLLNLYWRLMGWYYNTPTRKYKGLKNAKVELAPNGSGVYVSAAAVIQDPKMLATLADESKVTIHRGSISHVSPGVVTIQSLTSSTTTTATNFPSTAIILATGWHTPYPFFSTPLKVELGLPVPINDYPPSLTTHWSHLDATATESLLRTFPIFQTSPIDPTSPTHTPFRLYRYMAPPSHLTSSFPPRSRTIVFAGTVQSNVQTVTAETQAFWGVSYLLSSSFPDRYPPMKFEKDVEAHTALQTAFQERKYPRRGRECPSLLWEFIAYADCLLADCGLERRGGWGGHSTRVYRGFVEEWLERERGDKKRV